MDNNEIMARNDGATTTLFLNADGGPVAIGSVSGATDYGLRVNGQSTGGAVILGAANGLNPSVIRAASSTGNGVVLYATQTSSDATAVIENRGSGDLIRGFSGSTGGNQVFRVQNNGVVSAPSFNNTSDRDAKENFAPVDAASVLEQVAEMPISHWNFKGDNTRHVGPMAQDFHAAFGVGPDNRHIATVDADGVALAAIQGLNQKLEKQLEQKDAEIAELKARLEALEALIARR